MTRPVPEILRERAHRFDLKAAHAKEIGDDTSALVFNAAELLLREIADAIDESGDEHLEAA